MECKGLLQLEILRKKNTNTAWINKDLYRLMYLPELYITAYERLKSNPGNMTPGPDGSTLDGFSVEAIGDIIKRMRDESFQFSRARRETIPKPKGGTRPLGIAPPADKVVQEVMRMILEAIYDSPHGSSFSERSHGFRPKRGCHSALKEIRNKWIGVNWIIEGDIKGAFDNIDHGVLIGLLRKRISDERFLNLVYKALRAGYYEFNRPVDSLSGTPQGSIVSPILCNIYFDAFDKFVESVIAREEKGSGKKLNREYKNLSARLDRLRKKLATLTGEAREECLKVIQAERQKLLSMPSASNDPSMIKVKYVRYADDWIVGINGPHDLAVTLKEEFRRFFETELHLTLSPEKTQIRHAKTEEAFFLGTRVKIGCETPKIATVTNSKTGRTFTRRGAGWQPKLKAPVREIVSRLQSKGFCDGKGQPKAKLAWLALEDVAIIEQYNSVLWGILNYYSFADNYAWLGRIQYILRFSAMKTLANKHRTTVRQLFRKHGPLLTMTETTASGKEREVKLRLETDWNKHPTRFLISDTDPDPFGMLRTQVNLRSRSKLGAQWCAICGETCTIVMHHVRHIRKMGEKVRGFTKLLAMLNRKQIPVCRDCHEKIHRGEYDGMRLEHLYDPYLALK